MLQKGFIAILLLSGVLHAMGADAPNYDNRYDREVASSVGQDVQAMRATKASILSSLHLESFSFQEKLVTQKNGKKVKKNIPVKEEKEEQLWSISTEFSTNLRRPEVTLWSKIQSQKGQNM